MTCPGGQVPPQVCPHTVGPDHPGGPSLRPGDASMLDETKKYHKPRRLKGYDYSSPGYYFVTFNTKVRHEDILCSIAGSTVPAKDFVGPDHPGGPPPLPPIINLTPAGDTLQRLIESVHSTYCNAYIDCYVIMPDHVHLLVYLSSASAKGDPPRWSGPTRKAATLPQIINALKSMTSKRIGYTVWQEGYHDHIIRNDADLQATREYIQNNPLQWILDRTEPNGQEEDK